MITRPRYHAINISLNEFKKLVERVQNLAVNKNVAGLVGGRFDGGFGGLAAGAAAEEEELRAKEEASTISPCTTDAWASCNTNRPGHPNNA